MKCPGVLMLALVALIGLFHGCGGGGDKAGILAVAFRLDEGSPVMSAYIGNPTEDPFQLPPGRYYVEALDKDDVFLSLGSMNIKSGDVVALPPSVAAAGGVMDAGRAESLKTVASFLVDVKLAELAFLEIATAGFTLPPFDPAVEADPADIEALYQRYAEIAAQEDALRTALSQIEGRATVSLGTLYVRSPWAPPAGPWDFFKKKLNDWLFGDDGLLAWMRNATGEGQRQRIVEIAEQIPDEDRDRIFNETSTRLTGNAHDFASWVEEIKGGDLDHELAAIYGQLYSADPDAAKRAGQRPIDVLAREGAEGLNKGVEAEVEAYKKVPGVGKALELGDKMKEWIEYAQKLAEFPPGAIEETARSKYEEAIADKIKEDLKERAADLPSFTDEVIDKFADAFAKKVIAAVPRLVPTPAATVEAGATETAAATARATATPAATTSKASPTAILTATPAFTPARTATPAAETPLPTAEVTATPGPDTGWIEGYVQGITNQWLDKGYGGIDVAVAADDLRQCLSRAVVDDGRSQDEAIADCPPSLYEPKITPTAQPTATRTPEPTATPQPQPTATPAPQKRDITAVGQYLTSVPGSCVVEKNTVTLTYNTGGGPGSVKQGRGQWVTSCVVWAECPPSADSQDISYQGAYSPDPNTFSGTWQMQNTGTYYTYEGGGQCEPHQYSDSYSGSWQATLQGGVVNGDHGPDGIPFELTVQGP
jgi:hypothetical protein